MTTNKLDLTRLRSAIRRVWSWSEVHKSTKAAARIERGIYRCNLCKNEFGPTDIRVDHIDPFTPLEGFKTLTDWGPALVRMFDPNNHQVLCILCHSLKTKEENLQRKTLRKSGTTPHKRP